MRILGIDPGYAIVGFGVVDYAATRFSPVGFGSVTTPAGMPLEQRIEAVYDGMAEVIAKYSPDAVAIERLFFTTNQKTAIDVAQARGAILLAASKALVPIYEYTPLQVKSAVVGYGKAEKHQVIEMTRLLLGLDKAPKPDDTADALAVAICHAHSSGSQLMQYIKDKGL